MKLRGPANRISSLQRSESSTPKSRYINNQYMINLMRNFIHRTHLEDELYDILNDDDNEDLNEMQMYMINEEIDANNLFRNLSMIGVINCSYYTPVKRQRVERNIMSIASHESAFNFCLFGFATTDLKTLRDYLAVPEKFIVVSGQ